MSIVIKSDTYKIQISKKAGIGMMVFAGISLLILIAANIYWMTSYDAKEISARVLAKGLPATPKNIDGYVRYRILFSIIANTLVSGLYLGIVWWSINKRRLGIGFAIFWIAIFLSNGIAMPFYSVASDAFSIASGIASIISAIILIFWFAKLVAYRQRLRQEIARRRTK